MTVLAHHYAPEAWLYVAAGSVIGAFITPDMDLEVKTHTEALLRRVPVVGITFQSAWYPYSLLHRHRGWSHHILVGTAGRVAYSLVVLFCLLMFAAGVMWLAGRDPSDMVLGVSAWVLSLRSPWLYVAWWGQDIIHLMLDGLYKG